MSPLWRISDRRNGSFRWASATPGKIIDITQWEHPEYLEETDVSYVTEVVMPAALAELQKFPKADQKIVRMLRLATGTPQYVLDEEDAAAAAAAPETQEATV